MIPDIWSFDGLHICLHQLLLTVTVLLLQQQLECSSYRLVVWLVTVNVPIFKDHDFGWFLCVEEDAIAPWWGSLCIVDLFLFDVLVGGKEVDVSLFVEWKDSAAVVEVIFIFLQKGWQICLHIGFCQLLLSIVLFNGVKQLSYMFILGFEPEIHISNKEPVLTLIEKPSFISFVDGIIVDVLYILLTLSRCVFPCSEMAIHERDVSTVNLQE